MIPELTALFEESHDLKLVKAEKALLRSFRVLEPSLVSCVDTFDGDYEEEYLVLLEKGQPLGVVSMVVFENVHKPAPPKNYARLDLVIVNEKYRNVGLGHLLIICSLIFILKSRGRQLYSISCLAAHETVEKYLKELSFTEHHHEEKNFWQGVLDLEKNNWDAFLRVYLKKAQACLLWTKYKLRNQSML
jgi:GNAT superfamily N-acetyltransferase